MRAGFRFLIFFVALICAATDGFSQNSGIPSGISYQAVARDAQGAELVNKSITVRFSLIIGTSDGNTEWVETHLATTDQFGLFNLVIGEGTREAGSNTDKFSDIDWGADRYFLKVEIDFGSGYRNLGIMPFLSVPYALYAASSGNSNVADTQSLHFDTIYHKLSIERGNTVDLGSLLRTNYSNSFISDVELSGNILQITKGDMIQSIDLGKFNQQISYDSINNKLILSEGGTVNLSGFVRNSETNKFYISNMKVSGDSLIIYQGGNRQTINLSKFDKPQVYQHLTLSNNSLRLSNDTSIDLSVYLDNKNQHLSLTGDLLNLSNDTVGADLSKYNKYLSLVGNALFLTNSPNYSPIDLSQYQYYLQRDNNLNSYQLLDGKGQNKGEIYLAPYIQDLRYSNDRLWITGNKDSTVVDLRKYIQQVTLDKDSNKMYVTSGTGTSSFNITQSLQLNDSILSLSKDPGHLKINLNAFDNQQLHVNVASNKLSIDNGNTVSIDTDPTNEIQSLILSTNKDSLSLSKDPGTVKISFSSYDKQKLHLMPNNHLILDRGDSVDLTKYLDNTDAQQLSFSNGQLNLTNSTSVNVREKLFAFRAVNNTYKAINPYDTLNLDFTELLDSGTIYAYDAITKAGTFTCPSNGAGLYQFNIGINIGSTVLIRVIKNDQIQETLQKLSNYSLIYYMKPNDRLYLRVVNPSSGGGSLESSYFMGYRINQ